jgi:glutathione S-transferase
MKLFAHPFSSYCQKVLTALYENDTPFEFHLLDFADPATTAEFALLWPLKRMPVLVEGGQTIVESSIIIEHLDLAHPGPTRFVPDDRREALEVRRMDRCFDNYVMAPMMRIVFDHLRPAAHRDPQGVGEARALLDTAYDWLGSALSGRAWAAGAQFSLADCAAAPALFYADWVHPIGASRPVLGAYRARLLARPSFARAVDGGRPYRKDFPPGAPDRD